MENRVGSKEWQMWWFRERLSALVSQTFGSKFLLTYYLLKKVNEFVIRSSMQMEAIRSRIIFRLLELYCLKSGLRSFVSLVKRLNSEGLGLMVGMAWWLVWSDNLYGLMIGMVICHGVRYEWYVWMIGLKLHHPTFYCKYCLKCILLAW
jgi:predicted transcriptional regulator with HTH domain